MNRAQRLDWFRNLDKLVNGYNHRAYNLALQLELNNQTFLKLRKASANYLRACMSECGSLSDDELFSSIKDATLPQLANRTPNGAVLPKREIANEFNELHCAISDWVQSLNMGGIVDSIFCPITLRIMSGKGDPKMLSRPYATSKIHADVWAGDPGDGVNVIINLFGDSENTTVNFYNPPADFEAKCLKHYKDYDEGKEFVSTASPYPIKFNHGTVLFFDCIVPHQTIRKGGEARGTLQFNLRRKVSPEDKKAIEEICDRGKLQNFIPFQNWCELGKSKIMKFEETLEAARKGDFSFQPYSNNIYSIVDNTSGMQNRL